MAKHKAKKSPARRRSRRVSGFGGGMMQNVLMVVGGAVAGNFLHNQAAAVVNKDGATDGAKKFIAPAIVVAAGAIGVPKVIKGAGGQMFAAGMIASGGVKLAGALLPKMNLGGLDEVSGMAVGDMDYINGLDEVSGMDEDGMGGDDE